MVAAVALPTPLELPGLLVVDDGLVDAVRVSALRAAIASSKLPGASQLDGGFWATRGFGVACHARAVDEALARVPLLRPFVDVATDEDLWARLLRPGVGERWAAALLGVVNALYVNVLVVPPGAAVGRHVDATLGVATAAAGDDAALSPRAVVVLYVDVPDNLSGGVLRLWRGDEAIAEIAPRPGRLVAFRGTLGHEVTPVLGRGDRVSCVAELYALPRRRLGRLPRVRVQSHGFAAVLERLQARGGRASGLQATATRTTTKTTER